FRAGSKVLRISPHLAVLRKAPRRQDDALSSRGRRGIAGAALRHASGCRRAVAYCACPRRCRRTGSSTWEPLRRRRFSIEGEVWGGGPITFASEKTRAGEQRRGDADGAESALPARYGRLHWFGRCRACWAFIILLALLGAHLLSGFYVVAA